MNTTTKPAEITTEQLDEAVRPFDLGDLILEGAKSTKPLAGNEGNCLHTCARGAAIHALVKRGWIK